MKNLKKYLSVFKLIFLTRLSADLSFRMSFFAAITGSFCFIFLYIITLFLLMPHVRFGIWGQKEMWLFLGVFLIFCYTVFYVFWRGLWNFPENVRKGQFDFYLTRPLDSQFITTIAGGGVHNLLAVIFGIILTIWSISILGLEINFVNFILFVITLSFSILDFYSLAFFFVILTFRFGYIGEAAYEVWNLQSFSRYPTEAFTKIPLIGYFIAIPFSLIITIPAKTLLVSTLEYGEVFIFILISISLILAVRQFWQHEIKFYASGS
jgi:ABC-2 type transport system permease protein